MVWVTGEPIYRLSTGFNNDLEWSTLKVKKIIFYPECEMPFKYGWVIFTATKMPTASQITK